MEEKYSRKEIKKINSETMDRQKGNRQPWTDFWGKTLVCFASLVRTLRDVWSLLG